MKYIYIQIAILVAISISGSCSTPVNNQEKYTVEVTPSEQIQSTFDSLLIDRMTELRTRAAYGAVMEVKTGNIVALSNWEMHGDSVKKAYNHMLLDLVDPGSSFMIASYAALLENDIVVPESIIDTENTMDSLSTFDYHGKSIRDDHPCGVISADDAMVQSSVIAIAKMVTNAYEDRPQDYLDAIDRLGWFNTPDFAIEDDTLKAANNRNCQDAAWSRASLAQISYGYEMRSTPMHTLMFFNSIANDGIRPGLGRICSKKSVNQLKHALEAVVDHGTAHTIWTEDGRLVREGAKSQMLKMAGKTGIAQIFKNGTYSGNGHYVTFVGYFPADDPQYSCIVTMEATPGGNYGRPGGGYMAGPVVRKLAENICQGK